jgi:MFS transporter, PHS family, inorganic phosphate transporter
LSISGASPAISLVGVTIFWRIIAGLGIGGDYPTSMIITSEFAPAKWRGAMMATVFAAQGLGQFVAAIVSLCCAAGYKSRLQDETCDDDCKEALDQCWRILYGLGIPAAILALWLRLTLPESIRYTFEVAQNRRRGRADVEHFLSGRHGSAPISRYERPNPTLLDTGRNFLQFFAQNRDARKILLGTALSWALLDAAFVYPGFKKWLTVVWDQTRYIFYFAAL